MGYTAPHRDHIVEDVAAQRRERSIGYFILVPLAIAAFSMALAMMAVGFR